MVAATSANVFMVVIVILYCTIELSIEVSIADAACAWTLGCTEQWWRRLRKWRVYDGIGLLE